MLNKFTTVTRKASSLLLALIALIMPCCKEDDPAYECGGTLKDKSLEQIRFCIQGRWEIDYAVGRIAGRTFEIDDEFVEFIENDSIYFTENGTVKTKDKIEWRRMQDMTGETTYLMFWQRGPWAVEGFVAAQLNGNPEPRLVLSENNPDGFNFYLKR